MSLVVWLPLTKDLRNQGLSDVTITNNGATFDSGGKLGGCYKTSSTATIDLGYNGNQINSGSISFGGWFKFNKAELWSVMSGYSYTSTRTTPTGNLIGNNSYGGVSLQWYTNNIYNDNTLTTLYVQGYLRSTTNGARATSGVSLPFDTWVHIFFTFDKLSKVMTIWLNGEAKYTFTNLEFTDAVSRNLLVNYSAVAGGNGPSFNIPFLINDVRIYDHCLSPMEVKKLSKGLILHYPLNRNGWGQENLIANSGLFSSINGWTNNQNTTLSVENNELKVVMNQTTSSPGIKSTNTIDLSAGTYVASLLIKVENGNKNYINYPFYLATSEGTVAYSGAATKREIRGDYIYEEATFTTTSAINGVIVYVLTSGPANGEIWHLKWLKLEKGSVVTPWCPNSSDTLATTMGLNGTTEYDCSGFCNNGTKNNSPTYSSDTAKYEVSTHVDGVNQTIQLPNLLTLIPDSIFTFNIWFKRLSTEPSSKPWETLFGGPSGFEIETCSANNVHDNKIKAYSWGGGTFEFELDEWNMLTMVSNGTNALFYLNSELKLTGTYKALVSGNYFLGSWSNTSTQNYKGYLSDARIYATALSADDVKSLYQNCATIDADGTIHGQIRS